MRFEPAEGPEVEPASDEGRSVLRVTVPDPVLGQKLALDVDLVVLSAAVVPSAGSQEAARLFKIAMNPDGFFQEAHVKLRPVDAAGDGVFICGAAHYPKHISETIAQALGAAGRAGCILSQDSVTASGAICRVDERDCVSCGACITACRYGAISWNETPTGKKAHREPGAVQGRRALLRQVPDRRHRRSGTSPMRRSSTRSMRPWRPHDFSPERSWK